MSKKAQRKSEFISIQLEPEKQNSSNSLNQSLLVSSLRDKMFRPGMSYIKEAHQIRKEPPSTSLIRQQRLNQSTNPKKQRHNIFLDNQSESHSCTCQQAKSSKETNLLNSQQVTEAIQMLALKIEEVESKLSILFTRHAHYSSKIGDQQKRIEQIKYSAWESKQKLGDISDKLGFSVTQCTDSIRMIESDIHSLRKIVSKSQSNSRSQTVCYDSRRLQQRMERQKMENDEKLNQMIQALSQMGQLQRKVISSGVKCQKRQQNSHILPAKPARNRMHSYADKNKTNESTHISFSRNTDLY